MQTHFSTTPFGRRPLTLAQVAGQVIAKSRKPKQAVHKWAVFRDICAARRRIGVSERALAVLDALLSFHPETALTGAGLVVFPSNQQLSLRAHGMAPATLRRHLAVLVEAGLIVRRDSPNGKRYARKGSEGDITVAFGFDLAPLVVRAAEFAEWAEAVRSEAMALKRVRERITLARRDIAKMIAMGIEETIPLANDELDRAGGWPALQQLYRSLVTHIPRSATRAQLEPVADELGALAAALAIALERHAHSLKASACESQNERHKQNSDSQYQSDSEIGHRNVEVEPVTFNHQPTRTSGNAPAPIDLRSCRLARSASTDERGPTTVLDLARNTQPGSAHSLLDTPERGGDLDAEIIPAWPALTIANVSLATAKKPAVTDTPRPVNDGIYPLSLVRDACPDLRDYAPDGLANWRDVLATVTILRPILGISPSAWRGAAAVMGEIPAAIVVACILQRVDAITSPGGYLRNLTSKAAAGAFSVGPMLMALATARNRQKGKSA